MRSRENDDKAGEIQKEKKWSVITWVNDSKMSLIDGERMSEKMND